MYICGGTHHTLLCLIKLYVAPGTTILTASGEVTMLFHGTDSSSREGSIRLFGVVLLSCNELNNIAEILIVIMPHNIQLIFSCVLRYFYIIFIRLLSYTNVVYLYKEHKVNSSSYEQVYTGEHGECPCWMAMSNKKLKQWGSVQALHDLLLWCSKYILQIMNCWIYENILIMQARIPV